MTPLIPYFQVPRFSIPLPFMEQPLTVYGFGITLALGIMCGYFYAVNRAQRIGIDRSIFEKGFIWAIVKLSSSYFACQTESPNDRRRSPDAL